MVSLPFNPAVMIPWIISQYLFVLPIPLHEMRRISIPLYGFICFAHSWLIHIQHLIPSLQFLHIVWENLCVVCVTFDRSAASNADRLYSYLYWLNLSSCPWSSMDSMLYRCDDLANLLHKAIESPSYSANVVICVAREKSGSMYSTISSGTASQATPQGRRHKRAEEGVEPTIKRLPAQCLDH